MTYSLKFRLSQSLLDAFKNVLKSNNEAQPFNLKLQGLKVGQFIGFEELEWLHQNVKGTAGKFHALISSSELVLPEPEVPPRNPELEERIRKLKIAQDEREYKRMTKNVDSVRARHPEDTISYQVKQINRQLIAVLQFVISVVAGFFFGFTGIELMVGELEFGFRLLLGVIFSLIIALAEIYFLAKKLAEESDALDLLSSNLSKPRVSKPKLD